MKTEISSYEQQATDFLTATKTNFNAKFKSFDSMPFDKDGQKRNIFTITLGNDKHEYSFDFGTSVVDSCDMESKMSQLIESDKITLYAGLSSVSGKALSAGINITLTKSQLLTKEGIAKYVEELQDQINRVSSDNNKKAYRLFDDDKISRDDRDKRLQGTVPNGVAYQCINNAFTCKITELETELTYSKTLQLSGIIPPNAYDVLSCITKYDPDTFENFCSEFGYDEDSRTAEKTYNSVVEEWKNVSELFTNEEIEQLQEIQ